MPSIQQSPARSNALLHKLLEASLQLPPEDPSGLTNHLPMALHALRSLGANPQRMRAFYAVYARHFSNHSAPSISQESLLPIADWRLLRGQPDAYPTLLNHFSALVTSTSTAHALHVVLPDLISGVAAAALHGVIRTAHAVQADHAGEVAAALAYWAWRWQPLRSAQVASPLLSFDHWASHLIGQAPIWRSEGQLISVRMDKASQSEIYMALAGALAPAATIEQRIAELAALAVTRYVAQPNFTVSHMVTGLRALRTLLPWMQDSESMQATVVQCFVAAYLAAQVARLDPMIGTITKSWSDVIKSAIASDDAHVIKLVHACHDEAGKYGEGPYLLAASLATAP